jgi:hypothetical protein
VESPGRVVGADFMHLEGFLDWSGVASGRDNHKLSWSLTESGQACYVARSHDRACFVPGKVGCVCAASAMCGGAAAPPHDQALRVRGA